MTSSITVVGMGAVAEDKSLIVVKRVRAVDYEREIWVIVARSIQYGHGSISGKAANFNS